MASSSSCRRLISKSAVSSIKSTIRSSNTPTSPSTPTRSATASHFPLPSKSPTSSRFSFSRAPCELGCVQSLLPLHSAVAASRMTSCLSTTSRSCRALSQGTLCCTSPGL